MDVWKVITNEADDDDGGVLESFKRNVLFCRALKRDETYQAVIKTLEKAKDDEKWVLWKGWTTLSINENS